MPGTFLWVALGMGMAAASVALEGREDQSRIARLTAGHPWSWWLAGSAIYVALSSVYPSPTLALFKPDGLQIGLEFVGVGASAALFTLPAVFGKGFSGLPRRILANPVLSWLGVISYGLYLYHVPLQVELRKLGVSDVLPDSAPVTLTVVSLALAILCAGVSYYAFDRPILRFKDPRRARRSPAAPPGRA
jgi:peptidoglycan/LPS O-acetylase OafA/YrhL